MLIGDKINNRKGLIGAELEFEVLSISSKIEDKNKLKKELVIAVTGVIYLLMMSPVTSAYFMGKDNEIISEKQGKMRYHLDQLGLQNVSVEDLSKYTEDELISKIDQNKVNMEYALSFDKENFLNEMTGSNQDNVISQEKSSEHEKSFNLVDYFLPSVKASEEPGEAQELAAYVNAVDTFVNSSADYQEELFKLFDLVKSTNEKINRTVLYYFNLTTFNPTGAIKTTFENKNVIFVTDLLSKNLSIGKGSISAYDEYGYEYNYYEFGQNDGIAYPLDITVKDDWLYFITNDKNVYRIQKDLSLVEFAFSVPIEINTPKGIAYDKIRNVFWISDTENDSIFKVTTNGSLIEYFYIEKNVSSASLDYLYNEIYLSDGRNITRYNINGNEIEVIDLNKIIQDSIAEHNDSDFTGIAVYENSNFFVLDVTLNRLMEIGYRNIESDLKSISDFDINRITNNFDISLNQLEQMLNNLIIPPVAQDKYNEAINKFQNSKSALKNAYDLLKTDMISFQSFVSDYNYSNNILSNLYPTINSKLNLIKNEIKNVKDIIYDESKVEGAAPLISGLLPHRLLKLNFTQTPRIEPNITSSAPTQLDLLETPDIKFSPDIINKANSLTVPQLYGFVKEGVSYEPYFGSLKGSIVTMRTREKVESDIVEITWTAAGDNESRYIINNNSDFSYTFDLKQRSGNDIDQASLLIALLRSKGIPARYVAGTIEAPKDEIVKFLNVKNFSIPDLNYSEGDFREIMETFRDNGIPAEIVGNNVRFEHYWVTIWDNSSNEWIDVDPSFSFDIRTPIINVSYVEEMNGSIFTFASLDPLLMNLTNNSADFPDYSISDIFNLTQYSIEIFNETIKTYKNLTLSGYTNLPSNLPYMVVSRFAEYSELPADLRHYVTINVLDGTERIISYKAPSFDLSESIVGIRFNLTQESKDIDNQTIEAPFLLDYTPNLYIDSILVASSSKSKLEGNAYLLQLIVEHPRYNQTINSSLISSSPTTIVFDLNKKSEKFLNDQSNFVNYSIHSNITEDEKTINSLYFIGLNYFSSIDDIYEEFATANILNFWKPTTSITILQSSSEDIFSVSLRSNDQIYMDVIEDVVSVSGRQYQKIPEAANLFFLSSTAYMNSYMESFILSLASDPTGESNKLIKAPSGFSLLLAASFLNISTSEINQTNIDDILSDFLIPDGISKEIRNAVNKGYFVMTIKREIIVDGKSYLPILMSDSSGGMSYIIVNQGQYLHGAIEVVEDIFIFIEKWVKGTVRGVWKSFKFLYNIYELILFKLIHIDKRWDIINFENNIINWFKNLKINLIKHLKIIDGFFKNLGKIFDTVKVLKLIYNCLMDLGSLLCIGIYALIKVFMDLVIVISWIGAISTLGLSLVAAEVLKEIVENIAEILISHSCNPEFPDKAGELYKPYNQLAAWHNNKYSFGKFEGQGDREYYEGTPKNCVKTVTFGVDKGWILNDGLMPMKNIKYSIMTESIDKTKKSQYFQEIMLLPGDNFEVRQVDWLEGLPEVPWYLWFAILQHGDISPANGKEDYKYSFSDDTTFEVRAEDSGECNIDYKVFGFKVPGLSGNAKLPQESDSKRNIKEFRYDKGECCEAIGVDPNNITNMDLCMNTVSLQSSDKQGNTINIFYQKSIVYAKVIFDANLIFSYDVYVVKADQLEKGKDLRDISGGPEKFDVEIQGLRGSKVIQVWSNKGPLIEDGKKPTGKYEIIIDRDTNGIYNPDIDTKDPDGFIVTQDISDLKIAVDSKGNLHVITIEKQERLSLLLYAKISAEDAVKTDVKNPELFDWSENKAISFNTDCIRRSASQPDCSIIDERYGKFPISNIDIAIDKNGEPHIIYELNVGDEDWLTYRKLDENGLPDLCYDRPFPQFRCTCFDEDRPTNFTPKSPIYFREGTHDNCGNGMDILFYELGGQSYSRLNYPSIAVDPTPYRVDIDLDAAKKAKLIPDNSTAEPYYVPVISAKLSYSYPDIFYFQYIYPSCSFGLKVVPSLIHSLIGLPLLPDIKAVPIQYTGESLLVGRRRLGPGGHQWPPIPKSTVTSRRSYNTYKAASGEVSSCLQDVTISPPILDTDWGWQTISEGYSSFGNLDVSNVDVDNNGVTHVVFAREYRAGGGLDDVDILKFGNPDIKIPEKPRRLYYTNSMISTVTNQFENLELGLGQIQISDNGPDTTPGLDVDSSGIAHMVWTSGNKIFYANSGGQPQTQIDTVDPAYNHRPSISVDAQNNPHVIWVDVIKIKGKTKNVIYYLKGENDGEWTDFSIPTILVDPRNYKEDPLILSPDIDTNKLAVDNSWADKAHVAWIQIVQYKPYVSYKKSMPHVTFLLLIDGLDKVKDKIEQMPNLANLLTENPSVMATSSSQFPGTTLTNLAGIMTGVKPNKHKIIGDSFPSEKEDKFYLPENMPNVGDDVEKYLASNKVNTIYDYLDKAGRSKAALFDMFHKGVGSERPDFEIRPDIDWYSEDIINIEKLDEYLSNLKNNDKGKENDVAELVVLYLLSHDHGINTNPDEIDVKKIDDKIGKIINSLKKNKIFNDTILIVTSDHNLIDSSKDDEHGINNLYTDYLIEKGNVQINNLYLNGRIAYSDYYDFDVSKAAARVFFRNAFCEFPTVNVIIENVRLPPIIKVNFEKTNILNTNFTDKVDETTFFYNFINGSVFEDINLKSVAFMNNIFNNNNFSNNQFANNYFLNNTVSNNIFINNRFENNIFYNNTFLANNVFINNIFQSNCIFDNELLDYLSQNNVLLDNKNESCLGFDPPPSFEIIPGPIIEIKITTINYTKSRWFGKLENVLIFNDTISEYRDYSLDCSSENNEYLKDLPSKYFSEIWDLTFKGSPGIILIATDGSTIDKNYYFQDPHEAIYGDVSTLPFIVTGPGYKLFERGNNNMPLQTKLEDIAPTVAFFVGGKEAVDTMAGIDGKNVFKPQLTVSGGSPVNIHLYDSQGRHTGVDPYGNVENQIPSADFRVNEELDTIEITLLQAPDDYRVEVDAFGAGTFGLQVVKETENQSFTLGFEDVAIADRSFAKLNLKEPFSMEMDFDADGTFEMNIDSGKLVQIEQDIGNNNATTSIVRAFENDSIVIDVSESTDASFVIETNGSVSDGRVTFEKLFNDTLDSVAFYTFGSFVRVNIDDNILANASGINLTIGYPDQQLALMSLSEKSLSIYKKDGQIKLNSKVDLGYNKVTTEILNSGEYILAASDMVPGIENISVIPNATNIAGSNVSMIAGITDDGAVTDVNVTLFNKTQQMSFNPATGFYEANIIGPEAPGSYRVIVTAADDTNNTVSEEASFLLDLEAPEINIAFPENASYTTNRINLSFSVREKADVNVSVDGNLTVLGTLERFRVVNIPLTLSAGTHSIAFYASDVFGNSGSTSVAFEIESQNAGLSDMVAPMFDKPNKPISIKAVVSNTLMDPVNNVNVRLLVNGVVNQTKVFNLSGESSQEVAFSLARPEGRYNITLLAVPLPQEGFLEDNSLETEILITSKIPVLLVDDDPAINDSIYREAIQSAGGLEYEFISHEVSEEGPLSPELLNKFRLVVWFGGGDTTLSPLEQAMLQEYLNNRGYLLIFSSSLGKDIGDSDFYKGFLFADLINKKSETPTIEGNFGDEIGRGFLFTLLESGEEIRPLGEAAETFSYSGRESAAIKADMGLFKTAYFTFGLEDVPGSETRNRIMERVLAFFDIDIFPPVISNKQPREGSSLPVNTSNLTLSLQTDETAECRYSETTREFAQMTAFDSTNAQIHSALITNLSNGRGYNILINCRDIFSNENNTENISFSIEGRTFLPPTLDQISDIIVFENDTVTITVNTTDPEADPLTVTVLDREIIGFVPIASRFSIANSTLQLKTNYGDAGFYYLRVAVTDGLTTVVKDFILLVMNVNRPPVLTPIGDKVAVEDEFFSLDVNASDPDGDDLRFFDNTALFDIHTVTGMVIFTPKNTQIGNHSVNISVSDRKLTDWEVVNFRVTNVNDPPAIEPISPQIARRGDQFVLQINASDPDGDVLTFSDNTDLFNITIQGLIDFTPSNADVGTHFINITASDGQASDSKILNLVVTEENRPPIIISLPEVVAIINQTLEINGTVCDPDLEEDCV